MSQILEPSAWAEEQFSQYELGDVRRTRRLVKLAEQVACDPSGNTPKQTQTWANCKAAYRLMNNPQVTFAAITKPHYEQTRTQIKGTCLLMNDTTELDFGYNSVAEGLGPVGNGSRGFSLHSALVVRPDGEVIGLAGQPIRYRKNAPKNESRSDRLKRDRESLLWGQVVDQVGPPSEGSQWIDVCDRGADNFEVYCKMLLSQHDWVVRARELHRTVMFENKAMSLSDVLEQLSATEGYTLTYRSKTHGTRDAQMRVRYAPITMTAPRLKSPWLKKQGIEKIEMHVVEAVEINPPKGVKPLRWVLLTSLPVTNFDDAWVVIEHYEKRWIVEEYHKAYKTGCRVEERQYRTSDRLEAIAGLLAIAAVRLLQLRSAAKKTPDRPAKQIIPPIWITALKALRPTAKIETVRQFYRQLGGLVQRQR